MLEKVKSFGKKAVGVLIGVSLAAQNAAAEAMVTIPTTATADLKDTITTNFPVVLTVVLLTVACSILISVIKKGK